MLNMTIGRQHSLVYEIRHCLLQQLAEKSYRAREDSLLLLFGREISWPWNLISTHCSKWVHRSRSAGYATYKCTVEWLMVRQANICDTLEFHHRSPLTFAWTRCGVTHKPINAIRSDKICLNTCFGDMMGDLVLINCAIKRPSSSSGKVRWGEQSHSWKRDERWEKKAKNLLKYYININFIFWLL